MEASISRVGEGQRRHRVQTDCARQSLPEKYLDLLGHGKQLWGAWHENVVDALLPDPIIEDGKDFESEESNPKPVHDMGRAMDRAFDKIDKASRG